MDRRLSYKQDKKDWIVVERETNARDWQGSVKSNNAAMVVIEIRRDGR